MAFTYWPINNKRLKLKTPIPYGNQYLSYIRYKNEPVYIQMPKVKIPYGIQEGDRKIIISLDDDDIDCRIFQFKQFVNSIEPFAIEKINELMPIWFPDQCFPVKYKAPLFNDNNNISLSIIPFVTKIAYNGKETDHRFFSLPRGGYVSAVIEMHYIYLMQEDDLQWNCGIGFRLLKMNAYDPRRIPSPTCIMANGGLLEYEGESDYILSHPQPPPPPPPPPPPTMKYKTLLPTSTHKSMFKPTQVPASVLTFSQIIEEIKKGVTLKKTKMPTPY